MTEQPIFKINYTGKLCTVNYMHTITIIIYLLMKAVVSSETWPQTSILPKCVKVC